LDPLMEETHRATVGNITKMAWFWFRRHLFVLCLPYLLFWVGLYLTLDALGWFQIVENNAFELVAQGLTGPFTAGTALAIAFAYLRGRIPEWPSILAEACLNWPRLWLTSFIVGLITLCCFLPAILIAVLALASSDIFIVAGIALLVGVIPAVWFGIRSMFASILTYLRGASGWDRVRESMAITKRHFWRSLLIVILPWFIIAPITFGSAFLLERQEQLLENWWWLYIILSTLSEMPSIFPSVWLIAYFVLLVRQSQFSRETV
ncbi:MAG: hypothetical protein AAF226_14205, partial [Verrucomicrobiota bacterium]